MKTSFSLKYPFAALLVLFAVVPIRAAAPATDFKFQFGVSRFRSIGVWVDVDGVIQVEKVNRLRWELYTRELLI